MVLQGFYMGPFVLKKRWKTVCWKCSKQGSMKARPGCMVFRDHAVKVWGLTFPFASPISQVTKRLNFHITTKL